MPRAIDVAALALIALIAYYTEEHHYCRPAASSTQSEKGGPTTGVS
jgi:hypothetical protein